MAKTYKQQIKDTLAWKNKMLNFVEKNPGINVHIYSGQWGSYWRTGGAGYTFNKEDAGIFDINEAWSFVSHCGAEKKIEFRPVEV